jgi:hypothetical protein
MTERALPDTPTRSSSTDREPTEIRVVLFAVPDTPASSTDPYTADLLLSLCSLVNVPVLLLLSLLALKCSWTAEGSGGRTYSCCSVPGEASGKSVHEAIESRLEGYSAGTPGLYTYIAPAPCGFVVAALCSALDVSRLAFALALLDALVDRDSCRLTLPISSTPGASTCAVPPYKELGRNECGIK